MILNLSLQGYFNIFYIIMARHMLVHRIYEVCIYSGHFQ
ncbi:hypothetical protein JOC58_000868 [Paenibacillus hunanensis]|uniref:Uncharacterized protein n=1 Tax=Paenibacillus hunanensis TaxID=539262 RepID=A0ABU1IUS4_9BACL|nr:hypothetical protein [Paenibacillus hunanensis]